MPNNINFSLLITKNDLTVVENIVLENDVSSLQVAAAKIETTVINGSYDRGIVQGIDFLKAGTKVSFKLPLRQTITDGVQDEILKWKTILNNGQIYKYFLVRNFDGKEYKREMKPEDNLGYTSTFINNAGTANLSFKFIDNFYIGELLEEEISEFSNVGAGTFTAVYPSQTKVKTSTEFVIDVGNADVQFLSMAFYKPLSLGITFSFNAPKNCVISYIDGNLLVSGTDFADTYYFFSGTSPFLEVGDNNLILITNQNINSFSLNYKPRIDF